MREDDVDSYDNLILLCRNHHKLVDDQPSTYAASDLRARKRAHEEWVWATLSASERRHRADEFDIAAQPEEGDSESAQAQSLQLGAQSDELFSWRMSDAFPGVRGLTEITDPKLAIDRLDILFRPPIGQHFPDGDREGRTVYPFWWFRGLLNMYISQYERVAEGKCLIDAHELRVKRIAAYRTASPLWTFLYIEASAEPPSGAYTYDDGEIASRLEDRDFGYFVSEDYADWRGRAITEAEYEDSAAMIDGRPTMVAGAKRRTRYLTDFNMLVCGNRNVINENRVDAPLQELMDKILNGSAELRELASFVARLTKPPRYFQNE